jgi:tetratricopeptide (TPR) repeat protein
MPRKNTAILNVGKALMGISFTSLAAIGSASGNLLFAGLSALPLGILTASGTLVPLLHNSSTQQEEILELPKPAWWTSDIHAWQGVCAEIEAHLPHVLQRMAEQLQHVQGVVTLDVVRQQFINALTTGPLTWASSPEDRQRIGEYIVGPLFQRLDEALKPLIEQLQREGILEDVHTIAINSGEMKDMVGQLLLGGPLNIPKPIDLQPAHPPFDDALLPPPEYFIDRDEDRSWILTRLSPTERMQITALRGLPGIGKTALAAWAVHQLQSQGYFRDGIAVVLCQGVTEPVEVVRRVLTRFDPQRHPPETSDYADLADIAYHLLNGKESLVVLDNIEPALAVERVVVPLRRAGTALLLTARHVLPHTAVPIETQRVVTLLQQDEALKLFIVSMGRKEEHILPDEQQAIEHIVVALDRHTFAVRLAGAYAADLHRDLASLARELENPQRAIELPDGDTPRAVALVFAQSTDTLPLDAQQLFVALSAFPTTEMSRHAVIAMARSLNMTHPEASVDVLVRRALIDAFTNDQMPEESDRERLQMHLLLRAFSEETFKQWLEGRRAECFRSISEYYAAYAPGIGNMALAPDAANIIAALKWAHEQGQDNLVVDLCIGMRQFWRDRWSADALVYLPLGLSAARTMAQTTPDRNNRLRMARLSFAYGQVLQNLGRIDEADELYQESIALFQAVDDRQGEGAVLFQFSLSAQTRGQMEKAEAYLAESRVIAQEIGDQGNEGAILSAMSQFTSLRGHYEDAEQYAYKALDIFRKIGDREQEIPVLMHLGQLAHLKGQLKQAEALYQQAREAFRDMGNRGGEGTALSLLGTAALSDERPQDAERYLQESLRLTQEIGDRRGEAATLMGLGLVALEQQQFTAADSFFRDGLAITQEVQDRGQEGGATMCLAYLAWTQGHFDEAEQYYRQSLDIAREMQTVSSVGLQFGRFLVEIRGKHEEGCALLAETAQIYASLGFTEQEQYVRETARILRCNI